VTEELAKPQDETQVNLPHISQPACTAIQIALAKLLESWNIIPKAVTGHSSGEIAASYAAGFITFESALAMAFFRGIAAAQVGKKASAEGAMLALGVGAIEAAELIKSASPHEDAVAVIAAENSPNSVTISGDKIAIEAVERLSQERGIFARKLKVDVAYHSPHMNSVADQYLADIQPHSSVLSGSNEVACVSSVTGHRHYAENSTPKYWVENLVRPVQFSAAISKLVTTSCADGGIPDVLVEIGPHGALKGPINQTLQDLASQASAPPPHVEYLPSLVRGTASDHALLQLAGRLYTLGSQVDLSRINQVDRERASVLTGLPSYEWNKASRYQHQTAISTQKSHPGHAYDSLIGWKRPSSTANEHAFRQVFTLDERPWVREHLVAGEVVFPFTGFLSIAIAAAKALTPGDTRTRSVTAHEIHIKRPLHIKEEERVDLTTLLRPAELGTEMKSSDKWAFEIVSWSVVEGWTVHCTGNIEASGDALSSEGVVLKSLQRDLEHPDLQEVDAQAEYELLDQAGISYGPEFRTMQKLWHAPGLVVHETALRNLSQSPQRDSAVTTDAPTLGSFIHSLGMIQQTQKRREFVPTYVRQITVSNDIEADQAQGGFRIATRLESLDLKTGTMHVKVGVFLRTAARGHKEGSLTPIMEIESLTLKSITEPNKGDELATLPNSYYERLVPCLDFVDQAELVHLVGEEPFEQRDVRHRQSLNDVAAHFMVSAIATLTASDEDKLPSHLKAFMRWAERLSADASTQDMLKSIDAASLIEEARTADAKGEMLVAVGEQLPSILRLEVEPLEIMLKDGLLTRNYEQDISGDRCNAALSRLVARMVDSNPNLRILEIGGGTASATLGILEAATGEGQDVASLREYVFTDISSGFFENASTKLSRWSGSGLLRYQKLDIGKDPLKQGFVAGAYDVVVACNVLHATSNMVETIGNVKTLLKPGGKLLLAEGVAHQPSGMPYALLPGWWLAEDEYRLPQGPLLSTDSWHRLLSHSGFSGVEGAVDDYPGEETYAMTAIWTTKLHQLGHNGHAQANGQIAIAGQLEDSAGISFAEELLGHVEQSLGSAVLCAQLLEAYDVESPLCIFVDSASSSIFSHLNGDDFTDLQRFLTRVQCLLWVIPENSAPDAYMIKGMLRSLRLEDTSKNLILIENVPSSSDGAATVVRLAEKLTNGHPEEHPWPDQDFIWRDDMVQVPRLTPSNEGKIALASEAGLVMKQDRQIFQSSDEAFKLTVDVAGSPDSIYFQRTDALRALGDEEVVVRVEAVGVNFRDLLLVLGSIPWTGPGLEGAGVIHSVGSGVTDLRPGDRVLYLSSKDGYANYLRTPVTSVCRIPDHLTAENAAALPVAYSTALVCFERANLQQDDTVLIHAASGAVGLACISMVKHMGVSQIFVTCGSSEKKNFLRDSFDIPENHIFSSRNAEFKDGILSATNGRGVDVVINSLSGDLLQKSVAVVADFGRFIELGRKDFLLNNHLGMRTFDRNITFSGVDTYKLFTQKPRLLKSTLGRIVRLFDAKDNSVVPIRPVTTMPISQVAAALRKLQSGQNMGKIVVTMDQNAVVLAEATSGLQNLTPSSQMFTADGTYLLVGGTGGIGRALARWMVNHGARNIVILGRSAATNSQVAKLLSEYSASNNGVCMRAIACDVGIEESLRQALSAISDLPRVRGVYHGVMALAVRLPPTPWSHVNFFPHVPC
jgi:NADPH:quinone reductase-like Zn-dependent oxidoreductase/malonyl CoA-acyl carrier protein transacylase